LHSDWARVYNNYACSIAGQSHFIANGWIDQGQLKPY